jgi:hypothetical protein
MKSFQSMTEIQTFSKSDRLDNRTCFVAMPFGRTSEEQRWFKGWYQAVIEPAIKGAGYDPVLAAALDQPSAINDEIRSHLVFDAMAVVDLGGRNPEDPPNPNVMYELGIRHAFGLPLVLLAWEGQWLPFDVSNQRAILSRRDFLDIEPTKAKLTEFIQSASHGKFYNPMVAVGREAAIEKASLALGEESLLGALAGEVRDLRSAVLGKSNTSVRLKRRPKVKDALAGRFRRSELWPVAKGLGYDASSWSRLLSTHLTEERFGLMENWTIDDWLAYLKDRVGEFSPAETEAIRPVTLKEIFDATAATSRDTAIDETCLNIAEERLAAYDRGEIASVTLDEMIAAAKSR